MVVLALLSESGKPYPIARDAMTTPEINNRHDFSRILAQTTEEIDGLAAREPAYPVWANLRKQLHAMVEWTANGSDPTPEQCRRVSVGLMKDLTTRLSQ